MFLTSSHTCISTWDLKDEIIDLLETIPFYEFKILHIVTNNVFSIESFEPSSFGFFLEFFSPEEVLELLTDTNDLSATYIRNLISNLAFLTPIHQKSCLRKIS